MDKVVKILLFSFHIMVKENKQDRRLCWCICFLSDQHDSFIIYHLELYWLEMGVSVNYLMKGNLYSGLSKSINCNMELKVVAQGEEYSHM